MKTVLVIFILSSFCRSGEANVANDRNEHLQQFQPRDQQTDRFRYRSTENDFKPIFGGVTSGNLFDFNVDEKSNEITKASFRPMYQPLTASITEPTTQSPPLSTISTHLKQVSSPLNYSPMMNMNTPTPVIMQYMPQTLPGTGIQYLQLIPTRPFIVPISPYILSNAPPASYPTIKSFTMSNSPTSTTPVLHSTATVAASVPKAIISPPSQLGQNPVVFHPPMSLNYPVPVVIKTNMIPPYFRSNSGLEITNSPPPDLSLNSYEYIPSHIAQQVGDKETKA